MKEEQETGSIIILPGNSHQVDIIMLNE